MRTRVRWFLITVFGKLSYTCCKEFVENIDLHREVNDKKIKQCAILTKHISKLNVTVGIVENLKKIKPDNWIIGHIQEFDKSYKNGDTEFKPTNDKHQETQAAFDALEYINYMGVESVNRILKKVDTELTEFEIQCNSVLDIYPYFKNHGDLMFDLDYVVAFILNNEVEEDLVEDVGIYKERRDELERNIMTNIEDVYTELLAYPYKCVIPSIEEREEQNQWKWKCPDEQCKGFMDGECQCGVCKQQFCHKCHGHAEEGHQCDENIRKNILMLKEDSKPCPKCSTVIHKIDGCDQMWCPGCKGAFSWETGVIEKKIHNPHYYEYLRETQGFVPREEHDCEQVTLQQVEFQIDWMLHDSVRRHPTFMKVWDTLYNALFLLEESTYKPLEHREDRERLWRVQYLVGDITEKKWTSEVLRIDKAQRKIQAIRQVLKTYVTACYDIIADKPEEDSHDRMTEKALRHEKLYDVLNPALIHISQRYNCVAPIFPLLKTHRF